MEKHTDLVFSFRKLLILISGLLFLVLLSLSSNLYGEPADSIKMFRGNPQHTGYYGNQKAINSPKVKWTFRTNGMISSSPIIDNSIVYFGSSDGYLYAVEKGTGELKWKFETKGDVKSTPLLYNGAVYFISMDGNFYAISSKDGSLLWKFQTEGEKIFAKMGFSTEKHDQLRRDPWDLFLSSAVTDGKIIYFGCGDGNLYALDILNGNKIWSYKTGDVVHTSPALYNGKIYFGSMDHYFYALDGKTGNLLWKFTTGTDLVYWIMTGIVSSAAVQDDVVYFGCRDAHLYALDAITGSRKWGYSTGGSWVLASPSIYNGNVYFGTSDTKIFNSIQTANGKKNYSNTLSGYLFSSPAVCDSVIYFGSYNGLFYSCDIKTGKPKWIFKTEGNKLDSMHVLDKNEQMVLTIDDTNDSTVFASVNRLLTVGTVVSSPVVDNGDVYFGSTDGNQYALTEGGTTRVNDNSQGKLNYRLNQNYPNPFNPETVISYQLPVFSKVKLQVYDSLGREVAALVDKEQSAGRHEVKFDGSSFSSGIYLCKITAGDFIKMNKMVLMK